MKSNMFNMILFSFMLYTFFRRMIKFCIILLIISNQCVIFIYILFSWRFQFIVLTFLVLSSRLHFPKTRDQFLFKNLIESFVVTINR